MFTVSLEQLFGEIGREPTTITENIMKVLINAILLTTHLSLTLCISPFFKFPFKCWVLDSQCLTGRSQALVLPITNGIPELAIKKLDPILTDTLRVDEENFKFFMKDLELSGLRDAVIDDVSIDTVSKIIRLVYRADISIKSLYKTNGFLFSLPVIGEGNMTMRLGNSQIEMLLPYEIIKNAQGIDVMNVKGFQYSYDVKGGAFYHLDNLYYGDQHASATMHNLLHQNWKFLTIKYGPYLLDVVNSKVFNAIRAYMLTQPIHDLLNF